VKNRETGAGEEFCDCDPGLERELSWWSTLVVVWTLWVLSILIANDYLTLSAVTPEKKPQVEKN